MTFEIRVTKNDGTQEFTELEANSGMEVAAHVIADIRPSARRIYGPAIREVRYHEMGTERFRYA